MCYPLSVPVQQDALNRRAFPAVFLYYPAKPHGATHGIFPVPCFNPLQDLSAVLSPPLVDPLPFPSSAGQFPFENRFNTLSSLSDFSGLL